MIYALPILHIKPNPIFIIPTTSKKSYVVKKVSHNKSIASIINQTLKILKKYIIRIAWHNKIPNAINQP